MRRHRLHAVSLVFGLLFTAIGLTFLSGDVDVWRINWSWFWPAVLLLTGILVLLSARADAGERGMDDQDEQPAAWSDTDGL